MGEFHLLRPEWLLALVPILALAWIRREVETALDEYIMNGKA